MRNAIFISSGIGNALLLVPLIKRLKEKGELTAISTSPFGSHQIFDGFEDNLFDDVIPLGSTVEWMMNVATFKRRFHTTYLDHFASGRKNIALSYTNSKEVVTNTIPHRLPSIFRSRLRYIEPEIGIHEATQYMRYLSESFTDADLNEALFRLEAKPHSRISESPYITLQPGSGNNITPWKTLRIEKWIKLIDKLSQRRPELNVVVLGDDTETELSDRLPKRSNLINAIGKTALSELPGVVADAQLHVGNDSGLMHLAGCLGIPTLSIWGGSDPALYGWHKVNPEKHQIIYKSPECGPCSRWIAPNRSKTEVPSLCPDFSCLSKISVNEILQSIEKMV